MPVLAALLLHVGHASPLEDVRLNVIALALFWGSVLAITLWRRGGDRR